MASVYSLNGDCLRPILCFLDDPASFYNFALTCKRFLKVTKSTENAVHPNILRTKAECYLKHYLVELQVAYPNRVSWAPQDPTPLTYFYGWPQFQFPCKSFAPTCNMEKLET